MTSFKDTLEEYKIAVDEWLDLAKKQSTTVAKLEKAVATGNVRDLEKQRESARLLAEQCTAKSQEIPPFNFDTTEYMNQPDGYLAEFKEAADEAELNYFERDGVIFCYPVLMSLNAKTNTVRIDKKPISTVHPQYLAALLQKEQSREPKAKPEKFIETLFKGYQLVLPASGRVDGADISLTEIYDALTIMPGLSKEYTLLDFTRDLYFLDISGITETKKGYRMSLPASTVSREGAKKDILPFVTRDGHEKQYAAIKFVKSL